MQRVVLQTHYSSIELAAADFADARTVPDARGDLHVITVGSMAQRYKGTDVLIRALQDCRRRGLRVRLTIAGDGKYRRSLEELAGALDMSRHVRFTGALPGPRAVRDELDQADLFVLPSRTEGLPRALIEAMARGLPCIASDVGGIPELLDAEDLVPPGNVPALADKIVEVASDQTRRSRMSGRNLAKAGEYRSDVLRARRVAFYAHVRATTEGWLRSRGVR